MSYENIVNFLKNKGLRTIGITQNEQYGVLHRPENPVYGYRDYDNNDYIAWRFNNWADAEAAFNEIKNAISNLPIHKESRIGGELSYSPEIFSQREAYIYMI